MSEKYFEQLYDHYKETNQLRLEAQKRRNISFVWCCVLEACSFFFLIQPSTMVSIFQNVAKEKLGVDTALGNNAFQTLIWILLAYALIRYIQSALYVERQYGYQEQIEKKLDAETGLLLFGREGGWYNNNYPNSLNVIGIFYKTVCPVLFSVINVYRIIVECKRFSSSTVVDIIIALAIIVIVWAYFFDLHPNFGEWCGKHIPLFGLVAATIRKILKMV